VRLQPVTPHPLVRKLEHHVRFEAAEREALLAACSDVRRLGAREDLIRQGEPAKGVNLVLSGFACRYRMLPDGRRQVTALFTPGDFCDFRNFLLARMDHWVATLTPASVAVLAPAAVEALVTRWPRIGRALAWSQLVEEAIAREWLVNVGQRTALERTAHLLCELYWRLRVVGLTRGDACEMPFTQAELADVLGLSAVHVNRTLQELRRSELITLRERELTLHDLEALQSLALFDPAYLHLDEQGTGAAPAEAARSRA
jgi:CRP-like cAMP-binding protein